MTNDADKGVGRALRYFRCTHLAMESGRKAEAPAVMRAWHDFIEPSVANPFSLYVQKLPVQMGIKWTFHIIFEEEVYIA